jgi:hypothetical protein
LELNQYETKNKINNICINQGISQKDQDNRDILKNIEDIHNKLKIRSPELLKKIKECFKDKKISITNIERIANLVINKSSSNQITSNLEQFYDFISDPSQSLKQENIDIIFNEHFFNEEGNFQVIFKKMKLNVFTKQFHLENEPYFQKILLCCVDMNWSIALIYEFLNNIKQLWIEDEELLKKEIEKTQNKEEKKLKENELETIKIKNEKKKKNFKIFV